MSATTDLAGGDAAPALAGAEAPSRGAVLWILFLLTLGAGWFHESWLKLQPLGGASVGELLLVGTLFAARRPIAERLRGALRAEPFDVIVALILLVTVINVARNVAAGFPAVDVARNSRRMFYYSIYFLLVACVRSRDDAVALARGLTTIMLIGLASYAVTSLTGLELGSTVRASPSPDGTSMFTRVYHVMFGSAVVVGLLHFALALRGVTGVHRVPSWAVFAACTLLVFMSYYRNLMVTYTAGAAIVYAAVSGLSLRRLLKGAAAAAALAGLVALVLVATGGFDRLVDRLLSLGGEITDQGGTVGGRVLVWVVRWETITQLSPTLGSGFIWDSRTELTNEEIMMDPLIPDNDNGYGAALVVHGLVGIALFVSLYASALAIAVRALRRASLPPFDRAVMTAALGFGAHVLVNNMGLDNYHWPYAVLPNLAMLALIASARRFALADAASTDSPGSPLPAPATAGVPC